MLLNKKTQVHKKGFKNKQNIVVLVSVSLASSMKSNVIRQGIEQVVLNNIMQLLHRINS